MKSLTRRPRRTPRVRAATRSAAALAVPASLEATGRHLRALYEEQPRRDAELSPDFGCVAWCRHPDADRDQGF